MKILWHSVAPWVGTGYGQQTATFAPRIRNLGYDLAISAFYGIQGGMMTWNGIKCYPAYETGYGTDVVVTHALDHFGDGKMPFAETAAQGVILSLCDVWVLQAPMLANMPIAAWTPVDHVTLPVPVRKWFEQVGAAPIAMSQHGKSLLDEGLGGKVEAYYVPHGIDTSVFRPGDKAEARETLGVPQDAFVVAMVAANIGRDGHRKAFAEQISAFAEFREKRSDAVLMLHTDVSNQQGNDLMRFLRELPEGSYKFTDQYQYRKGVPAEMVAKVYQAADLFTNCSWGEGFGIPIIEAQACGTPVVVTDATAMIELCGAGWRVPYTPLWHESQGAWAAIPHIGAIAEAYDEAYDKAEGMRAKAADFAQMYDADFITDAYWQPVLKELEGHLAVRRESNAERKDKRTRYKIFESDDLLWADRGRGYEDSLGHGTHESYLAPILDDLFPEGGVLIDVGAHVGHWSLRLGKKASKVIAVEANPDTASMLRRNIAINDLGDKVDVLEAAVWDDQATLRLEDPNGNISGGSTRTLPASNGDGVQADRLDKLIWSEWSLPRLDMIKLDVEGADIRAIRGMRGLLDKFKPVLFIETHDCYGYYERQDLLEALADCHYTWQTAYRYQTTWSPNGKLDEPVEGDYLVATPVRASRSLAEVARQACANHGASQVADELADVLQVIQGHWEDGRPGWQVDQPTVVELGCDLGGTLWAWQQIGCKVYGITLAENSYETGGTEDGGERDFHGATVLHGNTHDQQSLNWLVEQLDGRTINVLVLDGDHTADGILQDLAMYGPWVKPGGLILLHDIVSVGDPRAEVHKVWPELKERYDGREIVSKGLAFGWGVIRVGPDGFDPPMLIADQKEAVG